MGGKKTKLLPIEFIGTSHNSHIFRESSIYYVLYHIFRHFRSPSPLLAKFALLWPPPLPPIRDYVIHECSLVNSLTKFLHTLKRLLGGSNAYYEIGIHEYLIHDFKSGLSCHKRTLSQGPLEKLTEHSKLHMTTWENERRDDDFKLDNLSRILYQICIFGL